MNKGICYKHLRLDIPPVLDMSVLSELPERGHVPISTNYINPELIQFMYARDIRIKNADVFCSPPGFELGIHVDGITLSNTVAINWAYCEKPGAVMQWWNPKTDVTNILDPSKVQNAYQISTTPYALAWSEDQVDFITEVEVGQPSMVNIGIPHGMKNKTECFRKALSITWIHINGDLQWDDATRLLGDLIVYE